MFPVRAFLIPTLSVLLVVVLLFAGKVNADPMPVGDSEVRNTGTIQQDKLPSGPSVKNPHGFLEYDGTGYHVVTRNVKPQKASQVRLKPVAASKATGESSTVYTIEVLEEKGKEPEQAAKAFEDQPRFTLEKVQDLDTRKGVAPEPKKEHKADVGVGVKVSESSEVMLGRGVVVERKDDSRLDSRDDGWRFRFKTNF
ncbi:MAG TPA: hypothetical protein DDZ40_06405 [Deltaproteobacteria bacterium]|nr:hypothetical protein [Deltaproteobacteria bacterium]